MARSGFLAMPKMLVAALLGAVIMRGVGAVVMARPLLAGGAEPPSVEVAAAGPAGMAAQGGGKPDRSIAGADVILVGFAAAVMVVIFWYIRITRKSSSSVEAARKLKIIKEQPAVVVEA